MFASRISSLRNLITSHKRPGSQNYGTEFAILLAPSEVSVSRLHHRYCLSNRAVTCFPFPSGSVTLWKFDTSYPRFCVRFVAVFLFFIVMGIYNRFLDIAFMTVRCGGIPPPPRDFR